MVLFPSLWRMAMLENKDSLQRKSAGRERGHSPLFSLSCAVQVQPRLTLHTFSLMLLWLIQLAFYFFTTTPKKARFLVTMEVSFSHIIIYFVSP